HVRVAHTGPSLNSGTGLFSVDEFVRNASTTDGIVGPFLLRLVSLTAGTTLVDAVVTVGSMTTHLALTTDSQERPVVSIPRSLADQLQTGGALPKVTLMFRSSIAHFGFNTHVFADPLAP